MGMAWKKEDIWKEKLNIIGSQEQFLRTIKSK